MSEFWSFSFLSRYSYLRTSIPSFPFPFLPPLVLGRRFGFNCGSVYTQQNIANITNTGQVVDRVALNMTLAASASGLTAILISSLRSGEGTGA